jgi:hypothetical protein
MLKKIMGFVLMVGSTFSVAQSGTSIKSIGEANQLIDKLKNNTIPQMREIHQCFVDARLLVDDYLAAKKLWVGKGSGQGLPLAIDNTNHSLEGIDVNIYRNFDALGIYQSQFFSEIQSYIKTYNVDTQDTLEGLQAQILKIDQGKIALSDKLYEMAKRDSLYLQLLTSIQIEAEKEYRRRSRDIRDLIMGRCKNSGLEDVAVFLDADARSVIANIAKLRAFTLESIAKRNEIVKSTYQAIRKKHVDAYTLKAGELLGQTGEAASDVLDLASVGEEMLNWWIAANMQGLAHSLHLKYLQFEAPKALLMVELQRAKKFEASIRSFKFAPAEMSAYYLARLATFQKSISENLNTLNSRGWTGQRDRQVLLNSKRKTSASRLSTECLDSLQRHLDAAAHTQTIEQFRNLEKLYAMTLEACKI